MYFMSKLASFIISLYNLTPSTAAFSSNFGSDIVFIGANLVFGMTNEQCGLSVLNKNFKYATVPYATSDALQNMFNWSSEAW